MDEIRSSVLLTAATVATELEVVLQVDRLLLLAPHKPSSITSIT